MTSPAGEKIHYEEPPEKKRLNQVEKMMKKTAIVILLAFAGLLVAAAPAVAAEDGAALFKTKCAACHGQDGSGNTAIGKKSALRNLGSAEVQKQTDAELTAVIADGKGKPAHAYKKKGMTDEQVKALVAHIRSLAKK